MSLKVIVSATKKNEKGEREQKEVAQGNVRKN